MELYDKSGIKSNLRKSFSEVIYAINNLNNRDYLNPRREGKWSPGDILGHLILSTKGIIKGMKIPKPILRAQFGISDREERDISKLTSIYSNALSIGVKAPATVIFRGVAEKGKESMIATFRRDLEILISLIDKWTEKDLSKYQLPHPAFGNLTVREMLYFIELHNYHHLRHIEAVKSVPPS